VATANEGEGPWPHCDLRETSRQAFVERRRPGTRPIHCTRCMAKSRPAMGIGTDQAETRHVAGTLRSFPSKTPKRPGLTLCVTVATIKERGGAVR
jgi:hypothetical protein